MNFPVVGEVSLAWALSSEVDEGDAWLTPAEAAILGRFRLSKRAGDWRLGRWVAKEAVVRALGSAVGPHDIEILAGPGGGPRARVLAPGAWPPVAVSLSHSAGMGFAAAAADDGDGMRLGCDIEAVALRSDAFVADYFTAAEAAWIRSGGDDALGDRHVRANLLWSAKESVLKALGEGLRKDTRSVGVEVGGLPGVASDELAAASAWRPLTASTGIRENIDGWWRVADGLAWTVVGWKDDGRA